MCLLQFMYVVFGWGMLDGACCHKDAFFGVKNEMCIVKLPLLVFWPAMNFFNHEVVCNQSDDVSAEKTC